MKILSYEDWIENSEQRMMWVWNNNEKDKVQRKVVNVIQGIDGYKIPVVVALSEDNTSIERYEYCAEIDEKELVKVKELVEEKELMTYQEFTWWLSDKPRREYMYTDNTCIFSTYVYTFEEQDIHVSDTIFVRENGGKWKRPTKDLFNA